MFSSDVCVGVCTLWRKNWFRKFTFICHIYLKNTSSFKGNLWCSWQGSCHYSLNAIYLNGWQVLQTVCSYTCIMYMHDRLQLYLYAWPSAAIPICMAVCSYTYMHDRLQRYLYAWPSAAIPIYICMSSSTIQQCVLNYIYYKRNYPNLPNFLMQIKCLI